MQALDNDALDIRMHMHVPKCILNKLTMNMDTYFRISSKDYVSASASHIGRKSNGIFSSSLGNNLSLPCSILMRKVNKHNFNEIE